MTDGLVFASLMADNAADFWRRLATYLSQRLSTPVRVLEDIPWPACGRMLCRGEAHLGVVCGLQVVESGAHQCSAELITDGTVDAAVIDTGVGTRASTTPRVDRAAVHGKRGRVMVNPDTDPRLPSPIVDSLMSVLRGLLSVVGDASLTCVPVLDEEQPLWRGQTCWGAALADLLRRRVARFGQKLQRSVSNFDRKLEWILTLLNARESKPLGIVHGELPGLVAAADTWYELALKVRDAKESYFESALERGLPIAEPGDTASQPADGCFCGCPRHCTGKLRARPLATVSA